MDVRPVAVGTGASTPAEVRDLQGKLQVISNSSQSSGDFASLRDPLPIPSRGRRGTRCGLLFLDTHPSATKRRALLFAALLLAALCALALTEASAPAKTPQEKLDATQGKLEDVRARPELAGGHDRRTERRDRLDDRRSLGPAPEAGGGRGRTGRKAERAGAGDRGAGEGKAAPRRGPRPARAAPSACCASAWWRSTRRARPTSSTRSSNRTDWSEMAAQTEYLNRIQSYDDSVVDRVKTPARRGHRRGRPAGRQPRQDRRARATRSPRSSAKSPPPGPKPRPASPN